MSTCPICESHRARITDAITRAFGLPRGDPAYALALELEREYHDHLIDCLGLPKPPKDTNDPNYIIRYCAVCGDEIVRRVTVGARDAYCDKPECQSIRKKKTQIKYLANRERAYQPMLAVQGD